jgi:hypothetical protein
VVRGRLRSATRKSGKELSQRRVLVRGCGLESSRGCAQPRKVMPVARQSGPTLLQEVRNGRFDTTLVEGSVPDRVVSVSRYT